MRGKEKGQQNGAEKRSSRKWAQKRELVFLFVVLVSLRFSSVGECLWVINVEAHAAAHC